MRPASEELRMAHDPSLLVDFFERVSGPVVADADFQLLLLLASELIMTDRRTLPALSVVLKTQSPAQIASACGGVSDCVRGRLITARLLSAPTTARCSKYAALIACLYEVQTMEQSFIMELLTKHADDSNHALALEALILIGSRTQSWSLVAQYVTLDTVMENESLVPVLASAAQQGNEHASKIFSALIVKLQNSDVLLREIQTCFEQHDSVLQLQARTLHSCLDLTRSTDAQSLLKSLCALLDAKPEGKSLPGLSIPVKYVLQGLKAQLLDARKLTILRLLYCSLSDSDNISSLTAEDATVGAHLCFTIIHNTNTTFADSDTASDLRMYALQCAALLCTSERVKFDELKQAKLPAFRGDDQKTSPALYFANLFASDVGSGLSIPLAHAHMQLLRALTRTSHNAECAVCIWQKILCLYSIANSALVRSMVSFALQRLPPAESPRYAAWCVRALQPPSTPSRIRGSTPKKSTVSTTEPVNVNESPLLAPDEACRKSSTVALLSYYGEMLVECVEWSIFIELWAGVMPLVTLLKDARAAAVTKEACRKALELLTSNDSSWDQPLFARFCTTVTSILTVTSELVELVEISHLPVCIKANRQLERLRIGVEKFLKTHPLVLNTTQTEMVGLRRILDKLAPTTTAVLSDLDLESETEEATTNTNASTSVSNTVVVGEKRKHRERMRKLGGVKSEGGGTGREGGAVTPKSKRKRRLRSRNTYIDTFLQEEEMGGGDDYADLEDFIVPIPGKKYDLTTREQTVYLRI